jgi:protein OS-9
MYRGEGWWVYEVCYKQGARQYHSANAAVTDEYRLGTYTAAPGADADEILTNESEVGAPMRYVRHVHSGGEPCEVTGEVRGVEVRYTCDPGGGTVLASVVEPRSCEYVFTVKTPLLCKHPAFKPQQPRVAPIGCFPVDAPAGGGSGSSEAGEQHGGACAAGDSCAAQGEHKETEPEDDAVGAASGHADAPGANNSSASVDGRVPEEASEADAGGVLLEDLMGGDGYEDYQD